MSTSLPSAPAGGVWTIAWGDPSFSTVLKAREAHGEGHDPRQSDGGHVSGGLVWSAPSGRDVPGVPVSRYMIDTIFP